MAENAKLGDLLARFESEAAKLNTKSDSINEILKSVEERLVKANAGVEAWVENISWTDFDNLLDADWTSDAQSDLRTLTQCQLGFAKVPGDGWRLAVRQVEYQQSGWDPDGEPEVRPMLVISVGALLQAQRAFRIKALALLPLLLESLSQNSSAQVATIEEAQGKFLS